jgi:hypothetical protein
MVQGTASPLPTTFQDSDSEGGVFGFGTVLWKDGVTLVDDKLTFDIGITVTHDG